MSPCSYREKISDIRVIKIIISFLLIGWGGHQLYHYLFADYEKRQAIVIESYKNKVRSNNIYRADKNHYYFSYQYSYAGEVYNSDRYDFGGGASEAICNLKKGQKIFAYINPTNPKQAVIVRRLSPMRLLAFIIGLMITASVSLSYLLERKELQENTIKSIKKTDILLNKLIGITILTGGIGNFAYYVIKAGTNCH